MVRSGVGGEGVILQNLCEDAWMDARAVPRLDIEPLLVEAVPLSNEQGTHALVVVVGLVVGGGGGGVVGEGDLLPPLCGRDEVFVVGGGGGGGGLKAEGVIS